MPIAKVHEGFNSIALKTVRDAARQSSCRRRQVGAALFSLSGELMSVGWNNEQPGHFSCMDGDCPRGMAPYSVVPKDSPYSDCIAQHAEMMVLDKLDLREWAGPLDLTLLVTHRPCHECTPILEKLGLDVYYVEEM